MNISGCRLACVHGIGYPAVQDVTSMIFSFHSFNLIRQVEKAAGAVYVVARHGNMVSQDAIGVQVRGKVVCVSELYTNADAESPASRIVARREKGQP